MALINQLGEYIIGGGGKRLRPLLVLLAGAGPAACMRRPPYRARRHHRIHPYRHPAARRRGGRSSLRRGRETANAIWGNPASVLVGDFLYSRAFQMMVEVDDMRVMRIMADATNRIAEGEVMQLLNCHDPDTTEERYMEVIHRKTATLFQAGAAARRGDRPAPGERAASAGRLRPAPRHRLPAHRRHAGLQRLRPGDGQESRRRPGRGQTHPAPDPAPCTRRHRSSAR